MPKNNQGLFLEVLKHLRRPHIWKSDNWVLRHDNAHEHSLNLVQQFMSSNWFPRLKIPLRCELFDDVKAIQISRPLLNQTQIAKKNSSKSFPQKKIGYYSDNK